MDSKKSKLQGITDKVVGTIKEGVGKATGNKTTHVEGETQQVKGDFHSGVGKLKDKMTRKAS